MFFDKRIIFRIRSDDYEKAEAHVKADPEIENISHLSRIALLKYIREKTIISGGVE